MLKKLRRRFTGLSMLLVSVVMIAFYIFTMAILFFLLTDGVQSTLENYASESYFLKYFELGGQDSGNQASAIDSSNVCVVSVNDAGVITYLDVGHAYMQKPVLNAAVSYVLGESTDFGLIFRYNLIYYKNVTAFGCRIAFADASNYFSYLKSILTYDSILFLLALIILFLITKKLSSIFVKPVERAWEQQQNFIADASHELKTPLTVILANYNILNAHRSNTIEEQFKWIESTGEEATHMKDLVDKMLMLAKADNQKQQLTLSELDLSEMVTKLCLQFEPVAFEKGVTLQTTVEPGIRMIGDSTALSQIVHILIDNAVKYAGMGGSAEVFLDKKQNVIRLSARNSGAPIDPQDLPHIFERFYRSDKARTAGGGYGLGLAICKTLVEQQKGEIAVASSEETGTEFTVRFKRPKKERFV